MKYPVFLYKKEDITRQVTIRHVVYNIKDRTETNYVDSFYSHDDLIEYLNKNIKRYYSYIKEDITEYSVVDYSGKTYSHDILIGLLKKSDVKKKKYIHRDGPVPGINGRYWYWSSCRKPKTRNEIKQNKDFDNLKKEYKIKGKKRKLPTSWDDVVRSSVYDKNWKRFRKTQYKC